MVSYNTDYQTIHYDADPTTGDPIDYWPIGMLLHDTEGPFSSSLAWLLRDSDPPVSCNILIDEDGTAYQLARDNVRTWHGGAQDGRNWYGSSPAAYGILDLNRLIGVELVHIAGTRYPAAQLKTAWEVCQEKQQRYQFHREKIGLHRWAAPSRKSDPVDLSDDYWHGFIDSLFNPAGLTYNRITAPQGARVRQGPGRSFLTAATLAAGTIFASDKTISGESINGSDQWIHYAGPTMFNPAPLGFIWAGICERVPAQW